jgi:tetraprenyl-beta-curcumene synthase
VGKLTVTRNPTSPSPRQVWALTIAAARELLWGLPVVAREIRAWRSRARAIPDGALRDDALHSLTSKRANTDGAALFSTLARHRNPCLLRLIVAYETIWDFLDNVSERGASTGHVNGHQLHLALIESLEPGSPVSDYYLHHPWKDDGGYLSILVETCHVCCAALPAYQRVRELLIREAGRSDVGAFNHELDSGRRDAGLRRWAKREFPNEREPLWFELTAAASCSAVVHILLVLAADRDCDRMSIAAAYAAYFPWFSVAVTMLDSYVDQAEDAATGAHSYIAHYPSRDVAVRRTCLAIERSTVAMCGLRGGHRHAVIVACMVAMYLSKDSARSPSMRATTMSLARAGGSLALLLLPVLRLWRIAYALRSA